MLNKNLKLDDADLKDMQLINEFDLHPGTTKNLRVNLAKMYKMDQKLSQKLNQEDILDNEETFNLLNGTQQKQGQIDTPIPIKEDVSFDAESDELNIVNYPKVSVL